MKLTVIKLGGSVITRKKARVPTLNRELTDRLCREIARAASNRPGARYLVAHGAGSFGHPLARRYDLINRPADEKRLRGLGETSLNTRYLTDYLTRQLLKHNQPAVPLQTNNLFTGTAGGVRLTGGPVIRRALEHGGLPVLGGDVLLTEDGRVNVISGDTTAAILAQKFRARRLLLATDVDGVFANYPPRPGEKALAGLSRAALNKIAASKTGRADDAPDVTGAMAGKLRELAGLRKITVLIFNGADPRRLRAALAGEQTGTAVEL